ncbi:MAG: HNH endonuclease [Fibrobacter sp.]|nr:HNH endonuclease [Fibrobacter sp.]
MAATEKKRNRPDHDGAHRLAFERNKRRIYATQTICGICGQPVDMKLRFPDPMSKCIDHIIPIDRSGHPSDISNLQLAHWKCNRAKANKLIFPNNGNKRATGEEIQITDNSNRVLPLSRDWGSYKAKI